MDYTFLCQTTMIHIIVKQIVILCNQINSFVKLVDYALFGDYLISHYHVTLEFNNYTFDYFYKLINCTMITICQVFQT